MSDLIDREQALNDARSWVGMNWYEQHLIRNVIEWLKEFPPAQLSTNLAEVGTDCISRQAAIDLIESIETERLKGNIELIYAPAIKGLRALPPAQPEPPEECERCMMEHTDEMEKLEAELAMAQPHWIPVTERLPKEEDSIFARYYGTDRWRKSMFRKKSREVIVTSVFEDGELHTEVAHTTDGEWHVGVNVVPRTVIAWMPLPEPMRLENK